MNLAINTPGPTGVRRRRPPAVQQLKAHPKGRAKPFQPTLVRATTARSLRYLESRGLADFSGCNLFVVPNKYPKRDAFGEVVMASVTDGSPTGGV